VENLSFTLNELMNAKRKSLGRDVDLSLFRLIRFANFEKHLGKNIDWVLYWCGKELGYQLAPKSLPELLILFRELRIGKVKVVGNNPIVIRVEEWLPKVGRTLCWFEGGIIAGALEKILKKKCLAREISCAGLGDDYCEFEIKFCNKGENCEKIMMENIKNNKK